MAAKFDKETMVKNHFWLLLIPTFIGVILSVVGAGCVVTDATEEKLKAFENSKAGAGDVKPLAAAVRQEEQKEKLLQKRQERWAEGWRLQGTDRYEDGKLVEKSLFTWPTEIPLTDEERRKLENLKFGEDIQSMTGVLTNIRENYKDIYPNLLKSIEPLQVGEKNNWKAVLEHVVGWVENPSGVRDPTSEEAWLALELYWVQKDFLTALAKVNESSAHFTPVTKEQASVYLTRFPKAKKTTGFDPKNPKVASFENRHWLVTLELVEVEGTPTIRGELTNKSPGIQLLGLQNEMTLLLKLNPAPNTKPTPFVIQGSSLAGGDTMQIKYIPELHKVLEGSPTGIFQVKQQIDARSAPVKLIDRLVVGETMGGWSSKHAEYVLEQSNFTKAAIEKEAKRKSGMAMTGMAMMGGSVGMIGTPPTAMMGGGPTPMTPIGPTPPSGLGMMGGLGAMGGGAGTPPSLTESGIRRDRYASVTDQVRVIPVGMRLVVDQTYLQDVLIAVAETRTRFQTTQMTWQRYQGTAANVFGGISPSGPSGPSGPTLPKGGFPPVFPKGRDRDDDSGAGGGGIPSFPMFPGSGFPSSSAANADDPTLNNLIEVAIYGLSTIYEKYEDKKTPAKGSTGSTPIPTPMGNMGTPAPMPMVPMGMGNTGTPMPMMPMGNMGTPAPMMPMGMGNMGTPTPMPMAPMGMGNMGTPMTPAKP